MNESSFVARGQGGGNSGFTSAESTLMFRKLLENEEFLEKFMNRFCDVMNTNNDTDTVVALDGHTFVKFVVTDTAGGATIEYTDSTIEVTLGSVENCCAGGLCIEINM